MRRAAFGYGGGILGIVGRRVWSGPWRGYPPRHVSSTTTPKPIYINIRRISSNGWTKCM